MNLSKMPLQIALNVAQQLAKALPVLGVKLAVGDFNKNNKADFTLEVHLKSGGVIKLGPVDVGPSPEKLIGDLFGVAADGLKDA